MKIRAFILTLFFAFCTTYAISQVHAAEDSQTRKYLFVITGDVGEFAQGKLVIKGVPIVSFFYLGKERETGHFLVSRFTQMWSENSAEYKANPPSGTLTVLTAKGSVGSVIQVSSPTSNLDSITFDAKVLEGSVPSTFNASSLFLELDVDQKLTTEN